MLQFDKVTKRFGSRVLFSEASFQVQKGEKCALLGRNGSGKTTLLRLFSKEEESDSGSIVIPKGYRFGSLKQHLHFAAPTLLEEAMKGIPEERRYQAERILSGLGFQKEDFTKPPSSFSGGYQLRLHLCQVLLSDPDGLLLDEPTNYLDLPSIRWMEKFLSDWKGELILISHDRAFVDSVCNVCLGIHREKLKKLSGDTEKYYQTLIKEEEIHEKTRINMEKKRAHLQGFVDRFGAKATKAAQAQSRIKALNKMVSLEKLVELDSLDFHFPEAPFAGRLLLEAKQLSFSYHPSQEEIIHQFSLAIEKGERIAVIGKNGRGKSTLLRLLAGGSLPDQGEIKRAEALRIGYFGQTNLSHLHPNLTIEEEVGQAAPHLSYTEIKGLCGKMMFEGDIAKKKIEVLSGGEKSRVLLAKILATPSNLLLLDEPTHHLDMESVEALICALEEFSGGIVLVSHSEHLLNRLVPSKIVLCSERRQEVFLGDYTQFLEKWGWGDQGLTKTISQERHDNPKKASSRPDKARSSNKKDIVRLEKAWLGIEEEIETLQEQLITLSTVKEKVEELRHLSQKLQEKKEESDTLLQRIEQLYAAEKEEK